MKKVIVIVGPTSSGKTKLSIQIAKYLSTDIINGDSVQVYQQLNIGSAKIKENEKEGVTHHLMDIVSPKQPYSVYDFQIDVRQLIEQIKVPIIVGGTGLYIKAALYDYEFVEKKRDEVFEASISHLTHEELYQKLLQLDPMLVIDQKNRRRLTRAYEQALAGNLRSSKTKKDRPLYHPLILYLDLPRAILADRLHSRLEQQIKDGFIEEVRELYLKDIHVNAIGYRELDRYLKEEITLDEAKVEIIKKSKQLAKKQKTWFINQMQPIVLDALSDTLYEDAIEHIETFLKKE